MPQQSRTGKSGHKEKKGPQSIKELLRRKKKRRKERDWNEQRHRSVLKHLGRCSGCVQFSLDSMPKDNVAVACSTCQEVQFEAITQRGKRILVCRIEIDPSGLPRALTLPPGVLKPIGVQPYVPPRPPRKYRRPAGAQSSVPLPARAEGR